MNNDLHACLRSVGAVPVIRSKTAEAAAEIGRELAAGGLNIIELTFTTPGVEDAIRDLSADPNVFVGAGTVLTPKQAAAAVAAGAQFMVSPVWLPWLPDLARELGVDAIPSAATSSEVWTAHSAGVAAIKFFPIARLGGAAYIKALLAPLPDLTLTATGGADLAMARDLLAAGCVAVGLGSIHTDVTLGDTVTERARNAVKAFGAAA